MERIVIDVEDTIARKWQAIPPKIKSQFEKNIQDQIDILSQSIQVTEFQSFLDKASDEAAKNGLTEEILQQLLNEE